MRYVTLPGKPGPLSIVVMLWFIAALLTGPAYGEPFECKPVNASQDEHFLVNDQLTAQFGSPPIELQYCEHSSYPKWLARWEVFETYQADDGLWRKFATATCRKSGLEYNCGIKVHAVVGDSHVVTEISQCGPELAVLHELNESIQSSYPEQELFEVRYKVVTDGGSWSEDAYGYLVKVNEPPEFNGGAYHQYVRSCDDDCRWVRKRREGFLLIGSAAEVTSLRRERQDPLIEYLWP